MIENRPACAGASVGRRSALQRIESQRRQPSKSDQYCAPVYTEGEQFVQLYKSLGGGWENYQSVPDIRRPQPAIIAAFRRTFTSTQP
jgi:hypothetical protein